MPFNMSVMMQIMMKVVTMVQAVRKMKVVMMRMRDVRYYTEC